MQVHQPYRLRRYSVFDADEQYFDDARNRDILKRVAAKCYLPTTQMMLDLIRRYEGRFKLSFSITGTVLEQLRDDAPEVIKLFQQLAETGQVEFLAETYCHSLFSLSHREEFQQQVGEHCDLVEELFGVQPRVFRNTELIYNNRIGQWVAEMGRFDGMLTEGTIRVLEGRSPNVLYKAADGVDLKLLLRNYSLSDDIAFRYSNREWKHWPLTTEKFAHWIQAIGKEQVPGVEDHELAFRPGPVTGLFFDYETFGEHQWKETGILHFLEALPGALLNTGEAQFSLPGEIFNAEQADAIFDAPDTISWADTERDASAWLGNAMQMNADAELLRLREKVIEADDEKLLRDWRRLSCSDHFYYMCTKYFDDGAVHRYFNPYESPYDSYINYMNVLDNLATRLGVPKSW
jgi:alpha-amylase